MIGVVNVDSGKPEAIPIQAEESDRLESHILVDEHDLDSSFGERLFRDCPCITDPLGALTVLAKRRLVARCFFIESHGVDGGRVVFYAEHPLFNVCNDLVASC